MANTKLAKEESIPDILDLSIEESQGILNGYSPEFRLVEKTMKDFGSSSGIVKVIAIELETNEFYGASYTRDFREYGVNHGPWHEHSGDVRWVRCTREENSTHTYKEVPRKNEGSDILRQAYGGRFPPPLRELEDGMVGPPRYEPIEELTRRQEVYFPFRNAE